MNLRQIKLVIALSIPFVMIGCIEKAVGPTPAKTVTISGKVLRTDTQAPVAGAVVTLKNPPRTVTTDSTGSYRFIFESDSSYLTVTITVKSGFSADTTGISVEPGKSTVQDILLNLDVQGESGSGVAATIAFLGASLSAISVREVGADETAILTFEVRDSLGIPVDVDNQATVTFFIQNGPGGGEYVYPITAKTEGSTGRARTTLNSGTRAGVVQIVSQVTIGARIIRSAPVIMNIFGGFPVFSHFSIGVEKLNFPGYDELNERNRITVLAGDKYSNPVRPGTAIYFSTSGGVIPVPGTAYTNDDGIATSTIISGNPRPIDPVFGPGFGWVRARTVGERGETVIDSALVLFSGSSVIRDVNPTSFTVPKGGASGPINFTVSDRNNNPLSKGTRIVVTLQYTAPPNTTINLNVTGDINITLGDTQVRGLGTTQFSFQVVDQTVGGVPTRIPAAVVIEVKSPNGDPPLFTLNGTIG